MRTFSYCLALSTAMFLNRSTAMAQSPAATAGPPGWNAALIRLFGDINAFSAKAEIRILAKSGQETASIQGISFTLLDRSVRLEFDLSQMKAPQMSPQVLAGMKQMGMDQLINITRPDQKAMYFVYPGLQAFVDMVMPEEEAAATAKDLVMDKTRIGTETIDGQPCVKQKVIMTDRKGLKREALVWSAPQLKDFPLQMQMSEGDDTVTIRYREVKLVRPDPKQFEAPTGYARYQDFQQLMQSAAQKAMSGAQPRK